MMLKNLITSILYHTAIILELLNCSVKIISTIINKTIFDKNVHKMQRTLQYLDCHCFKMLSVPLNYFKG